MNKRLIIIFVSLILLVLIVVLNSTVFIVSDITVNSDSGNSWFISEDIISSSMIGSNKNIFTISESKAIANIEQANPYVRVTSIERKFPNNIIIHVTIRVPIIAIKIAGEDNFFITDWELNVVDIVDINSELYKNSTHILGLSLTITGEAVDLIGTKLNDYSLTPITKLATSAASLGISDMGFKTFFKNIDFATPYYANIKTNSGVTFMIVRGTDLSIEDQFHAVYSIYINLALSDIERTSGYYKNDGAGWKWSATS